MYRLLKSKWLDRQELAAELFLSEQQTTAMMTVLRNKYINIETRPHPDKFRHTQFHIAEVKTQNGHITTRSIRASTDMLLQEMNKIRIEAEKLGATKIERIAIRALEASGLGVESTCRD
tara:strand:+ start:328 stop:684 length:357 start_codon:yes stop_codon:yes gene_type:complete